MKKVHLLVCLLFFCSNLLFSSVVMQSLDRGYHVRFHLDPFSLDTASEGDLRFSRIQTRGMTSIGEMGAPELFASDFDLAMDNPRIALHIDDVKEDVLTLPHPLYPNQYQGHFSEDKKEYPFCFNQKAYQNTWHVPCVSIDQQYTFRHQAGARIRILPFRYDPVKNTLTVVREIAFTLSCDKPTCVRNARSQEFDWLMRDKFINLRDEMGRAIPSEVSDKSKYLIITAPAFKNSAALKKLMDYRSEHYAVEVATTTEVGSDKAAFRKFVRDKMPAYLLLVGGESDFPHHDIKGGMLDMIKIQSLVYLVSQTTSGRLQPDIALGLFFVNSEEHISNIVHKTLQTEKNLSSLPKRFLGHAGNDQPVGGLYPDQCDVMVQDIYDKFMKPLGYGFIWLPTPEGNAKKDVDACNAGAHFMHYNGHGMQGEWCSGWGVSHLNELKNTVYPLVLSCACLTGTFTHEPCMAVEFVRHEKGAAAFIGASGLSLTGQHVLSAGLFESLTQRKCTYGLAWAAGINADEKKYLNQLKALKGAFIHETLLEWAAAQYHLFGDPAIKTLP